MKVAIAGYGRMANEYIKVLKYLNHTICILKRIEVLEHTIPIFYNISDMLDYFNPTALIVAISQENTKDFLLSLPKNLSIPILIEKPVAFENDDFDLTKEHLKNCYVRVGYNRRFYENLNMLKYEMSKNILTSVYVNLAEPIEEYKKQGVKLLDKYPLHYSASHIFDLLFYLLGDLKIVQDYEHTIFLETFIGKIPILIRINFNIPEITSFVFYFKDKLVYQFSPIERLRVYKNLKKEYDEYTREEIYSGREEICFKAGLVEQAKEFLSFDQFNRLATLDNAKKVSNFCNTIMRIK